MVTLGINPESQLPGWGLVFTDRCEPRDHPLIVISISIFYLYSKPSASCTVSGN